MSAGARPLHPDHLPAATPKLQRNAALEYAKANVRIDAVCPGGVRTNMTESAERELPGFLAKLTKHEPMGRLRRALR